MPYSAPLPRGTIRDRSSGSNPALKVYVSGHLLNENSWINSNTYALWPSLSGATNYQFEITNDPNTWANPITTSATSRNITSYLTGTPYYWHTRAYVDGVWQDWEQSPVQNINLNHAPVITLLGDDPLWVAPGGTYTEAAATAADEEDGDLTGSIAIDSGEVNTAVPGTYQVSYSVTDRSSQSTEKLRTVKVGIPPPTALEQLNAEASPSPTAIPPGYEIGGTAAENTVEFRAVVTHPAGEQVRLVVGLKTLTPDPAENWTWLPASDPVASGAVASVTAVIIPGNYFWVAKTLAADNHESEPVDFNGTGDDSKDFEYGFEPSRHAFKFQNRIIDSDTLSESDKWAIFNATFAIPEGIPANLADALKEQAFKNVSLDDDDWYEDGYCFGMSFAAAASYNNPDFMAAHFHDYWTSFQTGGNTWALDNTDFINTYGTKWDASNIAQKPVLEAIASLQASGESEEYDTQPKIAQTSSTVLSTLAALSQQQLSHYIIEVQYQTWDFSEWELRKQHGHALVPYKVDTSNNRITFMIPIIPTRMRPENSIGARTTGHTLDISK